MRATTVALAAVEVDQGETCGLEQSTRHLMLLTGNVDVDQAGGLGLPLRAPATGVRPRHSPLGHSHGGTSPLEVLALGLPRTPRTRRGVDNCPSGWLLSCAASKMRRFGAKNRAHCDAARPPARPLRRRIERDNRHPMSTSTAAMVITTGISAGAAVASTQSSNSRLG